LKLAYRASGEGHPLLILHGLFGLSDNWFSLSKKFSEALRVFAIDLRNHGLSPHSGQMDYDLMAGDIMEFIQEHRLGKPFLLGHSMGAKTLMFFEKNHPGNAEKLILVDMPLRRTEARHLGIIAALSEVDLAQIGERKQVEAILRAKIGELSTVQFLMKNLYRDGEKFRWRFNLTAIKTNYDALNASVPEFTSDTPTLVIKGGKSPYINPADEAAFRNYFTSCKIETIPHAGHWVHAEAPEEFFKLTMDFLSEASG
jgi:esterase